MKVTKAYSPSTITIDTEEERMALCVALALAEKDGLDSFYFPPGKQRRYMCIFTQLHEQLKLHD